MLLRRAESTTRNPEGFDDEPRVAFFVDPGLRIEALAEVSAVGVDMIPGRFTPPDRLTVDVTERSTIRSSGWRKVHSVTER